MTDTSRYTHEELTARLAEVERERDILRMEIDACRHTNNGLHKDKVELASMVGRLRHIAKESQGWNWLSAWEEAEDAGEVNLLVPDMQALVDALDSIDEHTALAEIRAEAGREGFIRSAHWMKKADAGSSVNKAADDYAQQLRNGGE